MNLKRNLPPLLLTAALMALVVIVSAFASIQPQPVNASGASTAPMPSCIPPNCAGGHEWYVSPTGTASGTGSITSPWSLSTALNKTSVIQPGDIIWVRGGTYPVVTTIESHLNGTADKPIVVRNYPDETAVIAGSGNYSGNYNIIFVAGNYTWLWGLEFMDTGTKRLITDPNLDYWGVIAAPGKLDAVANMQGAAGCTDCGTGTRLINLVVHDLVTGIGLWAGGDNIEAYGNLSFNNGFDVINNVDPTINRPHGHGFYVQNTPNGSSRWIQDNMSFDNYNNDIQVYGSSAASITNVFTDGNIFWNASAPTGYKSGSNFVLYGGSNTANVHFTNNMTYTSPNVPININVRLGNSGYVQQDVEVSNNYFANSVDIAYWPSALVTGNTVFLRDDGMHYYPASTVSALNWDYNKYYSNPVDVWGDLTINYVGQTFAQWQSQGLDLHGSYSNVIPTTPYVLIRPNKYEYGTRANMAIYNFGKATNVNVDLSAAKLADGASYKIINAQNLSDSMKVQGIYNAASPVISLPMTGWAAPTMPYGGLVAMTSTFPEFGAFIIKATASSTPVPPPPPPPIASTTYPLAVSVSGTGSGLVTGNGISCGSTCAVTVDSGTSVSLSAAPSTDSSFNGWGGACTGSGLCNVTVSAATNVSAVFNLLPDTLAPSIPTNLAATAPDSTKVNLTWSASIDNVAVMGYEIYRNGVLIGGPTGTSYTDTNVSAGSSYSYTVLAYDAAGNASAQSTPVSVTVPIPPQPAVSITSHSVTNKTATSATITWTTNVPSTGTIYYGTTQSLGQSLADTVSGTKHTKVVTGLSKSTKYYYKITATNTSSVYTTPISTFKTSGK